jgi:uncharacterized membrane protein (UPF0127 family)
MRQVQLENLSHPLKSPLLVGYANSFWSRLKGLMFTSPISFDRGLLLVQPRENRIDASIHMFFVNYDLGTVWIDNSDCVVDRCLARRWRPYYAPSRPARYILEINPARLDEFIPGDQLHFENLSLG